MRAPLAGQIRELLAEGPAWVRIGQLFTGKSSPLKNANLVFDSERILFVGAADQFPNSELLKPGQSTPDLDLEDHSVLPGLIDGHTHIFLEGAELDFEKRKAYQSQDPSALLAGAKARCAELVKHGIIGVRDGGDKDGVGLALSAGREQFTGTNVYSPGPGINRVKRYGSFFCENYENFDSAEEVVEDRIARGADHIKVVPTGIINFAKATVVAKPQYTVEELQGLTRESKLRGKHVMAHASGTEGIGIAIEGGVDTIEHGFFLIDEQLKRMADLGTIWVPTFAPVQVQIDEADTMGWGDLERDNLQKIIDGHMRSLQKAQELGVNVLVGSDAGSCGVGHASGFFYEMELMEQGGMSATDLINAATAGNAKSLLNGPDYGAIEAGLRSRLVFTEHNPAKTVTNLKKDKTVIFDGEVYDSSEANMNSF